MFRCSRLCYWISILKVEVFWVLSSVSVGEQLLTFWRIVKYSSSGSLQSFKMSEIIYQLAWHCPQDEGNYDPLKCWYLFTSQCSITTQYVAARTLNVVYLPSPCVLASCCHLSLHTLVSLPVSSSLPTTLYQKSWIEDCLCTRGHCTPVDVVLSQKGCVSSCLTTQVRLTGSCWAEGEAVMSSFCKR
jgi:hypothetical protein